MFRIINKYSIFLVLTLSIVSCTGLKKAGNKSKGTLFETFFVGEEGTQYFIKPIELVSKEDKIKIDFTFRYKNEIKDSVRVNFSWLSPDIVKTIDNLKFSNKKFDIDVKDVELLFNEREGKLFESRFTFQIPFKDYVEIHDNLDWRIDIEEKGTSQFFVATKKTSKIVNKLKNEVIILF